MIESTIKPSGARSLRASRNSLPLDSLAVGLQAKLHSHGGDIDEIQIAVDWGPYEEVQLSL